MRQCCVSSSSRLAPVPTPAWCTSEKEKFTNRPDFRTVREFFRFTTTLHTTVHEVPKQLGRVPRPCDCFLSILEVFLYTYEVEALHVRRTCVVLRISGGAPEFRRSWCIRNSGAAQASGISDSPPKCPQVFTYRDVKCNRELPSRIVICSSHVLQRVHRGTCTAVIQGEIVCIGKLCKFQTLSHVKHLQSATISLPHSGICAL